jgi:hypothetical protein
VLRRNLDAGSCGCSGVFLTVAALVVVAVVHPPWYKLERVRLLLIKDLFNQNKLVTEVYFSHLNYFTFL